MSTINDLKYILESVLGCECEKKGDHIRYFLRVNGREIVRTKYSHSWRGNQQISGTMLSLQAKQMGCSSQTWKRLLEGKLSKEEYFQELVAKGIMSQAEFDIACGKNDSPPRKKR
jgi:hypothetical protein